MRTLVLNLDMQPLSTMSVYRAIRLLDAGRIVSLADFPRPVRSATRSYTAPAVVVLKKYISVGDRTIAPTRRLVFKRDGYECQYCGGRAENIDHVVPRSKGGPHSWDNVVAACLRCNHRKGDRLLVDTNMELMVVPAPPKVASTYSGVFEEWDQALVQFCGLKQ